MEKSQRIPQIYGYLICLVSVITLLISITNLFNAIIDLNDPLHTDWYNGSNGNISFYESYRMEKLNNYKGTDSLSRANTPDEKTLQGMFTAEKNDRVQTVKHRSLRAIIVFSMLTIVALILFFTHWRWLRKLGKEEV